MPDIRSYSTTPASNATVGSFGAAEGMAPSGVNNSMRQYAADVRGTFEGPDSTDNGLEWWDSGLTPTRTGNTTFTVPTDVTAKFPTGRRLRLTDSATIYATVVSSAFGAVTTVTVVTDSGNLSASLTKVHFSPRMPSNLSAPGIFGKDTYVLTTGTSTALVASPVPQVPTLTTGHTITIRTHTTVGGTPNINVSGLGEKPLRSPGNALIVAGDYGADVIAQITYESGLSAWLINGGVAPGFEFPAQIFATGGDTLTATVGVINIFNGTAATSVTLPQQTGLASGFVGELFHKGEDVVLTLNAKTADTILLPLGQSASAITLGPGDGVSYAPGTANSMQGQVYRKGMYPTAVIEITSASMAAAATWTGYRSGVDYEIEIFYGVPNTDGDGLRLTLRIDGSAASGLYDFDGFRLGNDSANVNHASAQGYIEIAQNIGNSASEAEGVAGTIRLYASTTAQYPKVISHVMTDQNAADWPQAWWMNGRLRRTARVTGFTLAWSSADNFRRLRLAVYPKRYS